MQCNIFSLQYFGYWYHTYGNINRNAQEGNRCIRATYQSFSKYFALDLKAGRLKGKICRTQEMKNKPAIDQ